MVEPPVASSTSPEGPRDTPDYIKGQRWGEANDAEVLERVSRIVDQRAVGVENIPDAGGYSPARRCIATLADGSTVFVKLAVDDVTAGWIRAEALAYGCLQGAPYVAAFLAADEALLVLEDLRHGWWPPPWRPADLDRCLRTLDEVAATTPPDFAGPVNEVRGDLRSLWDRVRSDPEPLLGLGVCSHSWLEEATAALAAAASRAPLEGDSLLHFDVRSDNLCILPDRVVLVDWNLLCRGNAQIDRAFFVQTITVEGGPPPWELMPEADAGIVSVVGGFLADRAPGPPLPKAPRVRDIQLAQLRVSLPWAARVLGLPPPLQ